MSEDSDPSGFLSRWSRRKRGAGAAEREDTGESRPASAASTEAPPGPVADEDADDAEQGLTDADMPPLESLDASSDLSGFLSPGVSQALRRRALRQVFRGAFYQHRDGLDDYDGDYTQFTPRGDLITAEMRRREERLGQLARERESTEEAKDSGDESADAAADPAGGEAAENQDEAPDDDPARAY